MHKNHVANWCQGFRESVPTKLFYRNLLVFSSYLQSPYSAAQVDQAATRLRTSTWVTDPGGIGAGAWGGGGTLLSLAAMFLKRKKKNATIKEYLN